jgi:hypothetical protein
MKRDVAAIVLLIILALGFRLFLISRLPNNDDDDGRFYSLIARNLLDHHSYSGQDEEPYLPTYVRVPGYPLVLAGVYRVFGRDNQRVIRIIQAAVDTLTCWLIAVLAFVWAPREWQLEKRRRAMLIALGLAATCPFTAVYVTTLLTEVWATALVVAIALVSTLALSDERRSKAAWLWFATGLLGGAATMFRPDCSLFVGGAGLVLIGAGIYNGFHKSASVQIKRPSKRQVVAATFVSCVALSVGYASVLAPWTIRNARVFGVFQPVAPSSANMPNEFTPLGYIAWLRTWVDDERYVSPSEDALDLYPIRIEDFPDYAFDSPEERERVTALLDRYNNPSKPDPDSGGENDSGDPGPSVKMTPEIDAEFGRLAGERKGRHPLRYSLLLPLKRAESLWFDTHSQYYPFQGQLFPLYDLDTDAHQQYWLSLFAVLTWFYTIVVVAGGWMLWKAGSARRWVALLVLLIIPRFIFLSFQEHPEARYTVEFFALALAAGGIALARLSFDRIPRVFRQERARKTPSHADV